MKETQQQTQKNSRRYIVWKMYRSQIWSNDVLKIGFFNWLLLPQTHSKMSWRRIRTHTHTNIKRRIHCRIICLLCVPCRTLFVNNFGFSLSFNGRFRYYHEFVYSFYAVSTGDHRSRFFGLCAVFFYSRVNETKNEFNLNNSNNNEKSKARWVFLACNDNDFFFLLHYIRERIFITLEWILEF